MFDFADKVFLVTGTSSGMGRGTARELARFGAHVVCAARREDRGEEVLAEVRSFGGRGAFFKTDIADPDNVEALFAFIMREYGRLDGAYNNAADEIPVRPLPDIPIEDFDHVNGVNLRGTFLCLRQELKIMRDQKSGSAVNASSTVGMLGMKGAGAYSAGKHGVVGMTKSAALDMAEYGVRVNCICPGGFYTEMMQRWTKGNDEIVKAMAAFAPMGRFGTEEEIAGTVAWLFSEHSGYVTGQVFGVDGGVTAGIRIG